LQTRRAIRLGRFCNDPCPPPQSPLRCDLPSSCRPAGPVVSRLYIRSPRRPVSMRLASGSSDRPGVSGSPRPPPRASAGRSGGCGGSDVVPMHHPADRRPVTRFLALDRGPSTSLRVDWKRTMAQVPPEKLVAGTSLITATPEEAITLARRVSASGMLGRVGISNRSDRSPARAARVSRKPARRFQSLTTRQA
jgi:hypothetical protein